MNNNGTIIHVEDLIKHFPVKKNGIFGGNGRYVHAVDGVSFDLKHGEILGLVGESGCGKSTLSLTLMGLEKPSSGAIEFDGLTMPSNVSGLKAWRRNIQMVFQDPYESLNPLMTIREIVSEPIEVHSLTSGELRAAGYLGLNPNAMVPTLVDGTFTLWETTAIMQYLADKAGDDGLFPREPQKRADVVRWQCWEMSHFNRAFGTLAFEAVARPKLGLGSPDVSRIEQSRADLARFAPVLDGHLARRRHLVGDGVTIADYSMIAFESYRGLVPFDWAAYRNINAYFDAMRTQEPWVRATPSAAR